MGGQDTVSLLPQVRPLPEGTLTLWKLIMTTFPDINAEFVRWLCVTQKEVEWAVRHTKWGRKAYVAITLEWDEAPRLDYCVLIPRNCGKFGHLSIRMRTPRIDAKEGRFPYRRLHRVAMVNLRKTLNRDAPPWGPSDSGKTHKGLWRTSKP